MFAIHKLKDKLQDIKVAGQLKAFLGPWGCTSSRESETWLPRNVIPLPIFVEIKALYIVGV
jgi:hypothetical protein